jgi:hypothetical protein
MKTLLLASILLVPLGAMLAPGAAEPDQPSCPNCAVKSASPQSEKAKQQVAADVKALKALHVFVGKWRGAGYPKQGSGEGAWGEQADWAYDFDDGRGSLMLYLTDGKFYKEGRLLPGDKPGEFVFQGLVAGAKSPEVFRGAFNADKELVFEAADKPEPERPVRITLRTVAHGDRMIVLYERLDKTATRHVRLAEVGYTRKGSGFGVGGNSNQECVVTGGTGGGSYTYNGKAYPVCCSGCRDMMAKDPEGVLADYKKRKEEERKNAN